MADRPAEELADRPERWPVLESEDLHRDQWVVALRRDLVRRPGGEDEAPFGRLVLEHPGAVVVLALDDQDRVVLLRQYRHPAQTRFVELPAGLLDHPGEEPVDVARRELIEETGLAAETWTSLGSFWSSPGISAEHIHLFLARGLREVGRGEFAMQHEEADMEVFRAPFADLLAAVLDGSVSDGPAVVAVLKAHALGLIG
ncbi:NUDIX hydrolase [Nocardioides sp. GXZ039]|uniref:NUDIX hydrolase n=1 Tax=Nocardioides sp. GXZ039 TaxID=3136018 RepID=UPI0030F3B1D9